MKAHGFRIAGLFTNGACLADHFSRAVVVEPAAWIFTGDAKKKPNCGTLPPPGYQLGVPMASMSLTTVYLIDAEARAWL
ncbi:hypothetical protein EXIGLDRAFT_724124 [Exidia glandulosa HHB12029]|uniref:Uncharacterized protein n=1 Tax=Exidia glandulosa HHB12029 TaxID=1314781 RepID=A0A165EJ13_EXIGL|nr:hypothetical protein EXIGLDRAFT_724124 [Exidia glandulosa HHB12029]